MAKRAHIFVFGSNLAGAHGKGAAAFARRFFGAVQGQGEGAQGNAYAIPTKDAELQPLPLPAIEAAVERFRDYASVQHEQDFQVTRVGCGLAGYSDEQILPMFTELPDNCELSGLWLKRLHPSLMRLIVAGGRDYGERDGEFEAMRRDLGSIRQRHKHAYLEIVNGGARGADNLGGRWAQDTGVTFTLFEAQWKHYGKVAGFVRNWLMAWYATHLMAYWDGRSKGTEHMIKAAREEGLKTYVKSYSRDV